MKTYFISDIEFAALFDRLELQAMKGDNVTRAEPDKPCTAQDMHRAFNYVVRRWARDVGYDGQR